MFGQQKIGGNSAEDDNLPQIESAKSLAYRPFVDVRDS
jgi:hypothetical protein